LFGIDDEDFDGRVGYENLEHDDKIKKLIRGSLPVLKRRKVDLLEFKTWDEYVATLSPKELANEKLPNTVSTPTFDPGCQLHSC